MEAKGHCWRFSPEGKSTANGVIINVWRFEFLSPATPPLCPESSDYSSRTEHTFTPIKVSTENFKNVNHFTKTVLSCQKCFYLVVWPCTAKLRTNLWQIVLGKLTGPLCLLILLAPPLSSDRNSQDYYVHHCLQSSFKKYISEKICFLGDNLKLNCSNAAVLAHVPTRCDLKT